jgi:hypothetical protein
MQFTSAGRARWSLLGRLRALAVPPTVAACHDVLAFQLCASAMFPIVRPGVKLRSSAVSLLGALLMVPLAACSVAGSAQPDPAAMATVTSPNPTKAARPTQTDSSADDSTKETEERSTESTLSAQPGSDEATANATTALPDACDLLTHDEANTLAGRELQDAVAAGLENGANVACQYTSDPNGPGVAQVEVYVGDGAKNALDIDRDVLGHTFTNVPGIADEVLQEDGSIFIRKGDTWASINLVLLNDPNENVQRMQDAALIVANRLP